MSSAENAAMIKAGAAGAVPLGRMLTRSPVAFAVVSLQGTVIEANDAFADITGTERSDLYGRDLISLLAPSEQERVDRELDHLSTGSVNDLHTEIQFLRPDGSLATALVSGTAVIDDDNACVILLLQDVTSHRRAERASTVLRARLDMLAHAADLVHVELAVRPRMDAFAHMVVPAFCDMCAVYLRGPDGNLWLRGFSSAVPAVADVLRPRRNLPLGSSSDTPMGVSARTGTIAHIDHRDLVDGHWPHDELLRDSLISSGATSLLCAPLMNREQRFGAVMFGMHASSTRAFQSDDESFASDLVQRVSGALSNAIQFEDEHFIAERLQRALLPDRLPDVPGAEVVVRYRPSSGRGIGGDWYDVFRLPDGRIAFVVGDVIGHGIEAAVAMSTIRHALDAFGIDESDPVELVTKLNRFLCQQPGRTTATLALVVCDLHSGDLTVTTAGHLPMILRDGSGSVTFHGARLGRPLGLSANATFRCERTRLPLEGVLVLYTDGLVERRTESITTGIDRLAAGVAATSTDDGLERFADCIEAGIASVDFADDDVALLLVRRSLASDHYETVVEARADQLSPVRTDLRRWLTQIGCGEPTASDLVLAISECAANVVEHAYPPGVSGPLEIIAGIAPAEEGGAEIKIDVRDHGRWRAPRDVGGGRGHELLRHLVDDATFRTGDDGTSVALRRRVELSGPR
ncbi:MAG TPA: SpoIIE family protein phosphatase [Acidimicrobiia bacterium]|jgi:PAS domain S-box-containing protein